MANIRNAEEAILYGANQVESWRAQFLEMWMAPVKNMMVNMALQGLSPEQQAILAKQSPQALDQVIRDFNIRRA